MTQPNIAQALQITVERAGSLESSHLVDAVICDRQGGVIAGYGDYNRLVFPRSAIKPLQAIALVEYLLEHHQADRLTDADYSVICASHNGEVAHTTAVQTLLDRFSISKESLSCGAHWSNHQPTCLVQAKSWQAPEKIHNNCSGKHAGMLALGQLLGCDLKGYADVVHPVQQAIITVIEEMADISLADYTCGIDGCGAPAFSAPMTNWACAFARFTATEGLRGRACARIADGIAKEPFLIGGSGRACSDVNQAYGRDVTVKIGAEGVYAIAAQQFGLGAMLKVRDGNMRIAGVALGQILHDLGYAKRPELDLHFAPTLYNWAGDEVGRIRVQAT